jgi:hypothetical protein
VHSVNEIEIASFFTERRSASINEVNFKAPVFEKGAASPPSLADSPFALGNQPKAKNNRKFLV